MIKSDIKTNVTVIELTKGDKVTFTNHLTGKVTSIVVNVSGTYSVEGVVGYTKPEVNKEFIEVSKIL